MVRLWYGLLRRARTKQHSDFIDIGLALGTGQQAVMSEALEPIGENVDQEAANELGRGHAHDLLTVSGFDTIVFPAEGDGIGISADEARI